jgi:hypothetical protein
MVITTINPSEIVVINQLSAIQRGPHIVCNKLPEGNHH